MKDFKVGDRVVVVNYGHILLSKTNLNYPVVAKDGDCIAYDTLHEIIGCTGTIDGVSSNGNFSVSGIPQKHAWYSSNQLELIENTIETNNIEKLNGEKQKGLLPVGGDSEEDKSGMG